MESFLHLFYQFSTVSVLQFHDFISTAARLSDHPLAHLTVPQPSPLPRVETLVFGGGGQRTSTYAVADVLSLVQGCIDRAALKHLVMDVHVHPRGSLEAALSAFLRDAANVEVLTFGCSLDPSTHVVFPPTLRELRLRGRQTIYPRGAPHAVTEPGADWPWLFHLPESLFTRTIRTVSADFALQKIILWDQDGVPVFDDLEEDVRAALERLEWTRLELLVARVENFRLRLTLDLSEQPSSEARRRYHRVIEDSCRQLVPINVRDIVHFDFS